MWTLFRRLKVGPAPSSVVVAAGDAAEVSVFESVAVSFEGEDLGVVDEAVDHRGDDVVAVFGESRGR